MKTKTKKLEIYIDGIFNQEIVVNIEEDQILSIKLDGKFIVSTKI